MWTELKTSLSGLWPRPLLQHQVDNLIASRTLELAGLLTHPPFCGFAGRLARPHFFDLAGLLAHPHVFDLAGLLAHPPYVELAGVLAHPPFFDLAGDLAHPPQVFEIPKTLDTSSKLQFPTSI